MAGHDQDLSAKSPLLRVAGNGNINIGKGQLNYLLKPTVVATGGPGRANLAWKIDMQALAGEVKQKGQEVKAKLSDKLSDAVKELLKWQVKLLSLWHI